MEQMTLEDFNRLANGDRVTLVVALELLLQNGRGTIQEETPVTLTANFKEGLGGFFAEETLREIANVCQQLAALDTNILVNYIWRGGLDMKAPDAEEAGVCPICGGGLDYEDDIRTDDGGFFLWNCPACGATGKEGLTRCSTCTMTWRTGKGSHSPSQLDRFTQTI